MLYVNDLGRAVDWYEQKLGFTEIFTSFEPNFTPLLSTFTEVPFFVSTEAILSIFNRRKTIF